MNTTELKEFAQLAQASYALLMEPAIYSGDQTAIDEAIRLLTSSPNGGFAESQAVDFTNRYYVLNQFRDEHTLATGGFSATVFQDRSDPNRLVLGFAGTEFETDAPRDLLLTDLQIGTVGFAKPQALGLYRYVKQLQTAGGVAVNYSEAEVLNLYELLGGQSDWSDPSDSSDFDAFKVKLLADKGIGTGAALLGSGKEIDLAGHSLGGHLAMLAQRLFPGTFDDVVTVNAVAFYAAPLAFPGSPTAFVTEHSLSQFGEWVDSKILRMESVGDGVSEIALKYPGITLTVGMETRPTLLDAFTSNHSVANVADGLALTEMFGKLDPRYMADPRIVTPLFDAATAAPGTIYETLLDATRKIILGGNLPLTDQDNPAANQLSASRKSFYENLFNLVKDPKFAAQINREGSIAFLATLSAHDLQSAASDIDGIAYRYALKELNAFAVLGDNSLYTKFNPDHELDLFDAGTGKGLSPKWIEDRAQMLAYVIQRNTRDLRGILVDSSSPDNFNFVDAASKTVLKVDKTTNTPTADMRRDFLFGQDQTTGVETLTGHAQADHLYGGGGADILNGNGGDDYLEGGTGDDTLRGGVGNDTYRIDKNSGIDTIIDYPSDGLFDFSHGAAAGDGLGSILYNGQTLSGDLAQDTVQRGLYHSTDNPNFIIHFIGNPGERGNLVITDPTPGGSKIILQNWKSGELGLTLAASAGTVQTTDLHGTEDGDNVNLSSQPHGASLVATAPDQKVYGHGGSDQIELAFAGDIGYGGAGNDIIRNGVGDQALYGEDGNDILIASSGNDTLDGGAGDDALQGGADDDVLDGGDGMDLLDGGAGSDVIKGGAGDDFIFGGGNLTILLTNYESANDYNHLADGRLQMLHPGSNGELTLPVLIGVSPTDAGSYETGTSNIEGDGADVIDAGDGNDWVFAGDGDDLVQGGNGNDYLVGQTGNDFIEGGAGDDTLYGDGVEGDLLQAPGNLVVYTLPAFQGDDYIDGGAGNDYVSGDGGADELFGGDGDDVLIGDSARLDAQYHGADYLDGGDGNDRLYGYGKDDTLFGGAGDDILEGDSSSLAYADHGDDYLDGEDGDDLLKGDGGSDTLFGGAGNDQLFGDADDIPLAWQGDDYLDGEEGDDYLRGYGGNDTLIGGDGNDQLLAEAGDDSLDGGAGDDLLEAGDGNDTLTGGTGVDALTGGAGDDAYVFNVGDGAPAADGTVDAIFESDGRDTVRFGAGIALGNLRLSAANGGGVLVIDYSSTDRLAIVDGMRGAVESFEFEDGMRLNYSELVGRRLVGTNINTAADGSTVALGGLGDDTIAETGGRTTFSGGRGNDRLSGNGGNNIYLYSLGDGTDHIIDSSAKTIGGVATPNTLRFGPGITPADITLGLGSLLIKVGSDPNDAIHIDGFNPADALAAQGGPSIDRFEFDDGSVLTYGQLLAKGFDITGTDGDDALVGTNTTDRITGGAGNDALSGADGDDTLDGGPGDDSLAGGGGNDTYLWGTGSGRDLIDNTDAIEDKTDTLRIGSAADLIAPAQLDFVRSGNDLVVRLRGAADQVTVRNHYAGAVIDRIEFADGSQWDATQIDAHIINELTEGADIYNGTSGNDVIDGLDGDDTLSGLGGDDTLIGGAGADTLIGGAGADTLDGRHDAAADLMQGGTEGDTYLFGRGSGADAIAESGDALSIDVLRLDAGIVPEDIAALRSGDDLLLRIAGTGDQITVTGAYATGAGAAARIERIEFADGTAWTEADIRQRILDGEATAGDDTITGFDGNDTIRGLEGDDTLYGAAGEDTLDGGPGNDTLTGGQGSDTYLFNRGSGADTIVEAGGQSGDIDTIQFGAGIVPADVILNRVSVGGGYAGFPHLLLSIQDAAGGASTDSIMVRNFFASPDGATRIEQVRFADGTLWGAALLNATIASGTELADTFLGDALDDDFDGQGGNDALWGYGGNDVLSGGAGNDMLYGGLGNDTYRFGRGDGVDTISETYQGGGIDTLELAAGILPADVSLYANDLYANDGRLVVVLDNSSTQIAVNGFFSGGTGQVERIHFADGTDWDVAAINARVIRGSANAMIGTAGNDIFVVDDYGDTITEGANQGIDTVQSRVGWTLGANLENLTLTGPLNVWGTGNELNNVIIGNNGNNVLDGRAGADTLIGGKGDDTYYVAPLSGDTVTELADEGIDTVIADYSYTLPANVENLTMNSGYIGTVTSTGNGLDNVIVGRYGTSGDTLDGRGGNDTLKGGAGDDIYRFDLGGGADTIIEISGIDQLVFGAGILAANVTGSRTGSQVKLSISASDSVSFAETAPGQYAIERVVFAGGPVWQASELRQLLNSSPTGAVTVTGIAAKNRTLTAASTLADADGLGAIAYQWQSSADAGATWSAIGGATASTFTLTASQVGQQVRVVASYTDGRGTAESKASSATAAIVTSINSAPTGAVTISGATSQNQTLTASNTLADLDGLGTIGYQWQHSTDGGSTWSAIAGATASDFTVTETQVGQLLRVVAAYIDGGGTAESVFSIATAAIANVNDAPIGTVTITGSASQNQTLSAANTLADPDGLGSVDYQWQNSLAGGAPWTDIGNATADSFVLTEAQVGQRLRVEARYRDGHGTLESVASAATAPIANVNDAPTATSSLAEQSATAGSRFSLALPADLFVDADAGDALTWTVTGAAGAALPSWLAFDPATRTLSGTPAANGSFALAVTATDTAGAFVVIPFTLTVTPPPGLVLAGGDVDDALVGGTGNDVLFGGMGADLLRGGDGDDSFQLSVDGIWISGYVCRNDGSPGHPGSSAFVSITGRVSSWDAMDGGSGADVLLGTAGNDIIVLDDAYSPSPNGLQPRFAGIETIRAGDGADIVDLTSSRWGYGDVTVEGEGGNDVLWTSAGNDTLIGGPGNDTLDGGFGRDSMAGGTGDDLYVVDNVDDTVIENVGEGTDSVLSKVTLELGPNVENLILTGTAAIDATGNDLDNILTGNYAGNTLTGNAGNDILDGKAGSDILLGGSGDDRYFLGRGYGNDFVRENDTTAGNLDTAEFLWGIANDQLWFRRVGDNLEASIVGTADTLTVEDWYRGSAYHLEQFVTADKKVLLDSRVEILVQAMAAFAPPAADQTTLPASYQERLGAVIAANWQ